MLEMTQNEKHNTETPFTYNIQISNHRNRLQASALLLNRHTK
jgi:hypothetical protein